MKRIKTNIIRLDKLKKIPCREWLNRFKNGQIDAHEAFKKFGKQYEWLYENSDYDLIGWEIEKGLFDWDKFSGVVARYCPENLDSKNYNWKDFSYYVARYCPNKLDPEKFNWRDFSWAIAKFCPEKLDPKKYNWLIFSNYVARYCRDRLDPEKFNWEYYVGYVIRFCPEKLKLMPEKYKNKFDTKLTNYEKDRKNLRKILR